MRPPFYRRNGVRDRTRGPIVLATQGPIQLSARYENILGH